jgi:hypothetical protein
LKKVYSVYSVFSVGKERLVCIRRLAQVFEQCGDHHGHFPCLLIDVIKLFLIDISQVHGYVQMALDFARRRHSDEEKLDELLVGLSNEPFCYICHG